LPTQGVLPESRNKPPGEQDELISVLSQKAFVNYETPSVNNFPRALFLHKVATGESLYTAGNAQNGHLYTYTRLQESTQNWRLVVGGFAPAGLGVYYDSYFGSDYVGVAALRKF
jgi:hypothetical protein